MRLEKLISVSLTKLARRVNGSAMLEPLTAVVIISLTLTLAGASFANMMRSQKMALKESSAQMIQEIRQKEKTQLSRRNRNLSFEIFDVNLTYSRHESALGVQQQIFEAFDKEGNLILTRKYLIGE